MANLQPILVLSITLWVGSRRPERFDDRAWADQVLRRARPQPDLSGAFIRCPVCLRHDVDVVSEDTVLCRVCGPMPRPRL